MRRRARSDRLFDNWFLEWLLNTLPGILTIYTVSIFLAWRIAVAIGYAISG